MPNISLKAYRVNAGKSQQDMANMLECDVQTYRKIERTPTSALVWQLVKICEYLGIPMECIIKGDMSK